MPRQPPTWQPAPPGPSPASLAEGRLKLALVPVGFPEGNDQASVLARMLTDGLTQVLNTPEVDLISPQYLKGKAWHAGVTGDLDAYRATQIAEEEGAAIVFIGSLEPALDGLDLRCELLEGGTTRTSTIVASITSSDIPRCVDVMGSSVLIELGFEAPQAGKDISDLTDSPEAFDVWSKGLEAFAKGSMQEAAVLLEAATTLDPDFMLAYVHRARALWWAEEPLEAMRSLEPALQERGGLSDFDREKVDLFAELLRDLREWASGRPIQEGLLAKGP